LYKYYKKQVGIRDEMRAAGKVLKVMRKKNLKYNN
jgi:hypothetical protein